MTYDKPCQPGNENAICHDIVKRLNSEINFDTTTSNNIHQSEMTVKTIKNTHIDKVVENNDKTDFTLEKRTTNNEDSESKRTTPSVNVRNSGYDNFNNYQYGEPMISPQTYPAYIYNNPPNSQLTDTCLLARLLKNYPQNQGM